MTISPKEIALLGLINEKPKHAYEIENDIKERDMRYWTDISMSSVYKIVNKLEKNGLLQSELGLSDNNISQKVYSITSQGVKVLKDGTKDLVSMWRPTSYPLDIALSNLALLSKEEAIQGLESYSESLDMMICCYEELEKKLQDHGCDLPYTQMATRRVYLVKAEKEWAVGFIRRLQEG